MKLSRFPLRMAERRGLLVAADLVLTCGAVLVAFLVWALKAHRPFELDFVLRKYHWFPVLTFLWFVSALLNDLYNLKVASKPQETASALLRTSLLVLAVYLAFYFFSPPRKLLPRGIVLYHAAASFVLVGLWRMGYIFLLTRPGFRRRAIVIGAGRAGREIVRAIQENISSGYHIVGFVDDDPAKQGLTIEGVKVIGTRYDLVRLVKEESVSELILAITWDIHDDLTKAIMDCQERGVQITPMFLLYEEITGRVPVGHIGHNWTLALPTDHASTGNFFPLFKRTFDIIVSAAGLVVLGALFPFLALAIYIDSPGPIFYTQRRVGRGGKVFRLFKLRSMVPDAERDGRPVWASEKDKRVTRVGRFLRATHLDELPQFINVLKGDMSIVGPRPERPEFVAELEKLVPFYRLRHAVRPGMAGWALINHGYSSSVEDARVKIEYDLYYIKHQSIWLDITILFRTILDMLSFRGR